MCDLIAVVYFDRETAETVRNTLIQLTAEAPPLGMVIGTAAGGTAGKVLAGPAACCHVSKRSAANRSLQRRAGGDHRR